MLEFLAGGGNYVAILILCITCWIAGRSAGHFAHADEVSQVGSSQNQVAKPLFEVGEYALLRTSLSATSPPSDAMPCPAGKDHPHDADCEACIASAAAQLHSLIRHGDLSQEGVIESLVAMAEAQAMPVEAVHAGWLFATSKDPSHDTCPEARILTRTAVVQEPLPAELADPLTPEVLSRYRMYAEECGA